MTLKHEEKQSKPEAGSPVHPARSDESVGKSGAAWRTGSKVPINVYDENGAPVCQCQTVAYAKQIVAAVNYTFKVREAFEEFDRDLGAAVEAMRP